MTWSNAISLNSRYQNTIETSYIETSPDIISKLRLQQNLSKVNFVDRS